MITLCFGEKSRRDSIRIAMNEIHGKECDNPTQPTTEWLNESIRDIFHRIQFRVHAIILSAHHEMIFFGDESPDF